MKICFTDDVVAAGGCVVALSLALVVSGCADGAPPPLEDLPLRDTLQASPLAVASLPRESVDRLAARSHAARLEDDTPVLVGGTPPQSTLDGARLVDHARRTAGSDALLAYTFAEAATEVRATRLAVAEPSAAAARIQLEGERDEATLRLEEAALTGPARSELAALATRGVRHFVRVKGWPVAILVRGDTAYVNAAWLVLEGMAMPPPSALTAQPEGPRITEVHVTAAPPPAASASPDGFHATGDSASASGAGDEFCSGYGCCKDPCAPCTGMFGKGGLDGPSRDASLLGFAPIVYLVRRARRTRRDP